MGLVYEIVPDAETTIEAAAFRGRVLHRGEPLAGALVVAMGAEPSRSRCHAPASG
jgi:uncharacterized GH25 family protein